MSANDIILSAQGIGKQYRLGLVGTGTLSHDFNRWWYRVRGKGDPYLKIGESNDRSTKGESDYVWALKDINFEVKRGEVLGIIGKNGAGKSTLLKILSRVTSPTTGQIKTKGRIASLLEVGTGFHPEMTGRENIYLNGAILGMTKAEIRQKEEEIIDFSGCARYIDTPVKRYSSGMRVRLAFAVAAHLEPEILVVDEVLAVGDAEFQKKAIGKMQDISHQGGRTVLFVSHNMASVKYLCNAGIILEKGRIGFSGSANDAVSEYLKGQTIHSDFKLKDRTDRRGSGEFKFVDFKIKNESGVYVEDVISYEPVEFELHYEKNTHFNNNVIIGLNFRDDNENIVMAFISDEMKCDFSNLDTKGVIRLKVKNLPLRAENYTVRLLSFNSVASYNMALDVIDNAAHLNVLPGDIYRVGKVQRSGYGAINKAIFEIYNNG